MWNPTEFNHAPSSYMMNSDYSGLNSLTGTGEGEGEGEGSELSSSHSHMQISNEYDKLFLGDWLFIPSTASASASPYSCSASASERDFSSSSLIPLSPFPLPSNTVNPHHPYSVVGEAGELDVSVKTMGVSNGDIQFNGSQGVTVTELEKLVESGEEKSRGESSSREPKKLKPSSGQKPLQEGSGSAKKQPAKGAAKKTQRLGPKIIALQRLISPYGKTDAASVLNETANNIRYLHEQIKILAAPYIGIHRQLALANMGCDLHSRGLCLVPVSPELVNLTSQLASNRNVQGNTVSFSRFRI